MDTGSAMTIPRADSIFNKRLSFFFLQIVDYRKGLEGWVSRNLQPSSRQQKE